MKDSKVSQRDNRLFMWHSGLPLYCGAITTDQAEIEGGKGDEAGRG